MRKIIFDTETTGVGPDKQACEVALLEIDDDLNILGEASSLIRPTCAFSAEASAITGITAETVKDAPTIEEWVMATFGEGGLEGEVALIGHKVYFDKPLFTPIGNAVWALDTLVLAQTYIPEAPNHKLDTLKEHLGLEGGGVSHRAMADVMTCYQLLRHLVPLTGRKLIDLATVPFTVIHICPWGRHKGKPLMQVPQLYRQWMLSKDIDHNLRRSLEMIAVADIPLPGPRKVPMPGVIKIPMRVIK